MLFHVYWLFSWKKKLNAWKRVFSVLQKAVSAFVPTKFSCFPKEKSSIFIPKEKSSICRDSLIFQPLYNYNFIINQVLLFSTCI